MQSGGEFDAQVDGHVQDRPLDRSPGVSARPDFLEEAQMLVVLAASAAEAQAALASDRQEQTTEMKAKAEAAEGRACVRDSKLTLLPHQCVRSGGFGSTCGSGRCYESTTLFRMRGGEYKTALDLKKGDRVRSYNGEVEVYCIQKFDREEAEVVDLHTNQSKTLTLSVGHRVMVPESKTRRNKVISMGEKCSHELKKGDEVVVGDLAQKLDTDVKPVLRPITLVKVYFIPDDPVEVKMAPPFGILTKGEPLEIDIRTDDGFED